MRLRPRTLRKLRREVVTLAGAAIGGCALGFAQVPGGWLSGAMIGVAICAALGGAGPLSTPLRRLALTGSGVAIGSAMSPAMLKSLGAYPASLAFMAAAVAAITYVSASMLQRIPGWSPQTAFFAAVPGALSYVFLVAAQDGKADLPRIAVVQVCRVFFLMALIPLIVGETTAVTPPRTGPIDPPLLVVIDFVLGGLAGYVLERLNVAGGMLFGAMLVSGFLHATGVAPGRSPLAIVEAAQVLIGAWVGARFIGFDWGLLARSATASVGSFLAGTAVSMVFAAAASIGLSVPFAQTMVAFSPGGLEAMTILAFALGLDPLYVGALHLARFILISLTLPFALRFWLARARRLTVPQA
ncbi:MAG TPA: AbrB family transcriptional regulator [Beijerinckiaceae bacterium]|nr:AbrB family transcriptional regulator [Beijerinckiaceae bacterium]